jgi:hypothetical protein
VIEKLFCIEGVYQKVERAHGSDTTMIPWNANAGSIILNEKR